MTPGHSTDKLPFFPLFSLCFSVTVSHKSLGLEVTELTSSRLLKLEKENQSLLKTVEELRSTMDDSVGGNSSRIVKMEKENQRLNKKVVTSVF